MPVLPPSNFNQASHGLWHHCEKCGAEDRPGATIIDVQDGVACCLVCAHSWRLKPSIASRRVLD